MVTEKGVLGISKVPPFKVGQEMADLLYDAQVVRLRFSVSHFSISEKL